MSSSDTMDSKEEEEKVSMLLINTYFNSKNIECIT